MRSFLYVFIVISVPNVHQSQSKPGCPPPVSEFVSYPTSVKIPKISPIKVATLTVRENSYFGTARCSLLYDLSDPRQVVYKNFKIKETSLSEENNKVKECDVWLSDINFQDTTLDIEVVLIVALDEGYREYCDTKSSTAKIEVTFCDPRDCLRGRKDWEIVGNVVKFKNSRSVDGDRDRDSGYLTAVGNNKSKESSNNLSVEEQRNNKILLGLTLVVTLVAFSLILGLIYFWCPSLCCCMARKVSAGDLNSTKILTVRDSEGKVIEDAQTVEVWKTRGNIIKTLDVLQTGKTGKTGPQQSRTSRKSSRLQSDAGSDHQPHGMKVINVGDGLDGLIILRKSDHSSRQSRMTLIEEIINPRTLRAREEMNEEVIEEGRASRPTRSARDYFYPNDRKEIFGQGAGGERLETSQSASAVRPQPLSKKLKDNLIPFHDENRTPSPAVNLAGEMVHGARNRRRN